MTLTEAIQQMKVYFDQHGWPLDVGYDKLIDRVSLSPATYGSGWTVIEIERHRAILGATYTQGAGMNAFQTYWMRYALNPVTGEVKELAEETGPLNIDVPALVEEDLGNDFGLEIGPLDNGKYEIYDSICNRKKEVSNVEEVITVALAEMQGWSNSFKESLQREESIAGEKIDQLVSEYEEAFREQVTEKARRAWEEREEV